MEKIIAIIFDSEEKAYKALQSIKRLDSDSTLTIYGLAVVRKDEQGLTKILQEDSKDFPVNTLSGTMLGSFIGLLGGPAGLAIGASTGAIVGLIGDAYRTDLDSELLQEVLNVLNVGKVAIVLDADEDWITPLDSEVEQFSGIIFRSVKSDIEMERETRKLEERRNEIRALEAELAEAKEEQKAKIQSKLDTLKMKVKDANERFSQRVQDIRKENRAKIDAIENKITTVGENRRNALKRHLQTFENADIKLTEKIETSIGEKLRKAGEHILGQWQ